MTWMLMLAQKVPKKTSDERTQMKARYMKVLLCLAILPLLLSGCGKTDVKSLSESKHLLEKQNQFWNQCLESWHKGQPDLRMMMVLQTYICDRTRLRMEKDYTGPNKAQAMQLLKELGEEYNSNLQTLTQPTEGGPVLKPGVTEEELCKAFIAMNDKYQKLVEMTKQ